MMDSTTMPGELKPDPQLFPFQSRWYDGAGPRVHYVDEGSGPTVVMFHGNPTWSFLYRKVILALRDRFRCVAVDYPGFGLSERPSGYGYTPAEHATVIGKLVDSLNVDRFTVVGQDWGGPIGMSVAMERATRVSAMVFANTWYWPAAGSLSVFSIVMSTMPMQWLILQRNFFVNAIMPGSVAKPLDANVVEAYQNAQPSPGSRRGVAEFPRQIRRARRMLSRLANEAPIALRGKPIELVWGMKDPAFGRETVIQRWLRDFPTARVTRLTDASHYVQEDAPEALAAAVVRVAARETSVSR
jgi:haloalkane dehalogenase